MFYYKMTVYKCAGKVHKCYIFAGRDDLSSYEKTSILFNTFYSNYYKLLFHLLYRNRNINSIPQVGNIYPQIMKEDYAYP